jgi:ligand-binding SRPBCC domain-containing protein
LSRIEIATRISASRERIFDLARSVDAHLASTARTKERVVGGRTSGLMELGDEVTWRARHFGIEQELTARIVAFDRPRHFRDSMVRGAFARFDHDHFFEDAGEGITTMRDVFDFDAPLGLFGRLANALFLERYMRRFLLERARVLRELAER